MQTPQLWPPSHSEYDQAEEEEKEQEQMQEELPAVLLRAEEEEENRERELKRDFNFPLGGNDLLAYLIIFLLLIVGFVLLVVFHVI